MSEADRTGAARDAVDDPGSAPSWYLRCRAEDVGDRAVLVGDRGRVAKAAELLDEPAWFGKDRGLTTVTGRYRGKTVTVSAFGMGAPIAAVVLHELASLGVRTFLRLGTALAIGPTRLGDLVIADGAVRGESTSATYAPLNYPAVADHDLNSALRARVARSPRPAVTGLFASFDGFYTEMVAIDPDRAASVAATLGELAGNGVCAGDMETSVVLVAARVLGARAGSLCLATVDPLSHRRLDVAAREAGEHDLLRAGLAALTDV